MVTGKRKFAPNVQSVTEVFRTFGHDLLDKVQHPEYRAAFGKSHAEFFQSWEDDLLRAFQFVKSVEEVEDLFDRVDSTGRWANVERM